MLFWLLSRNSVVCPMMMMILQRQMEFHEARNGGGVIDWYHGDFFFFFIFGYPKFGYLFFFSKYISSYISSIWAHASLDSVKGVSTVHYGFLLRSTGNADNATGN